MTSAASPPSACRADRGAKQARPGSPDRLQRGAFVLGTLAGLSATSPVLQARPARRDGPGTKAQARRGARAASAKDEPPRPCARLGSVSALCRFCWATQDMRGGL